MPCLISDLALSSTFTHVGKNSAGSSRPQLKNSSLIPRACETQRVVKHLLLFLLNVLNKMFSRWENQEQWADHFLNSDKSNKRQQRKYVLMHWRTKKKRRPLNAKMFVVSARMKATLHLNQRNIQTHCFDFLREQRLFIMPDYCSVLDLALLVPLKISEIQASLCLLNDLLHWRHNK